MRPTRPIAQTTQMAYATVIPDEPLPSGDPRYVPLDVVRGTHNMAELLAEQIKAQESAFSNGMSPEHARFLLTGHPGCGKTTELYRLKDLLIEAILSTVTT